MSGAVSRFIRQHGTSRNYLDTETGRIVSRRERDQLVAGFERAERGQYVDTRTGERVSSKVRQQRTREPGRGPKPIPVDRYRLERAKRSRYQSLLEDYVHAQREAGATVTVRGKNGLRERVIGPGDARNSSEFKALLQELKATNKDGSPAKRRIKNALIALGRRDNIPYFVAPGDSAKYLRKLELERLRQERLDLAA